MRRLSFLAVLLSCLSLAGFIASASAGQTADTLQGKVTKVIEASGYTYVEIDSGDGKVWAAGPVTPLKKGDRVGFATDMPMQNFHSKAMDRDFSVIYFVNRFMTDGESAEDGGMAMHAAPHSGMPAAMTAPHGETSAAMSSPHSQLAEPPAGPVPGIARVSGGYTIAEIIADKQQLKGKSIRVRGKVTKYTGGIMGKNWLHIMDGSSGDDLTVTTGDTAAVDDVVIVEGKLELDKDFNYGYVYALIVEDGKVTKE